jgi:single-strand DNA-binding protein
MGKSLNRVQLIGNLGKDPELRTTGSGLPVANFSIAMNTTWTDADGVKQESTEWANIIAWKKLAEICNQYLHKGSKVYVEGRMQTRSWDDKNHPDIKRYTTEVVIDNMIMLDGKDGSVDRPEPGSTAPPVKDTKDTDLPF